MIAATEARVNVTWNGQNGELPDAVRFNAPSGDILAWVTEAVRGGGIPGIVADRRASFHDFIVDRFPESPARPYNLVQVRPRTPFG